MLIILSERECLITNKCVYIKVTADIHKYTPLPKHHLRNCTSVRQLGSKVMQGVAFKISLLDRYISLRDLVATSCFAF